MMLASKKLYLWLFIILLCSNFLYAQNASTTEIEKISQTVQRLVPKLKERTVAIKIKVGIRVGYGSGAIISESGIILTCAHVTEASNNLSVVTSDGKEYPARKLGKNSRNDYSLLKIEAKKLPFFSLGSSKDLKILQWVIALGHPGGSYPDNQPAVAIGRLLGFNRKLPIQFGVKFYDQAIQSDVPIFAGNSGGPLVDLQGRLVGINGAIMMVNNLAFSIPIDEIKKDLKSLRLGAQLAGRSPGSIFEIFRIMTELQEDIPPQDLYKIFEKTPIGKIMKMFGGGIPQAPRRRPILGITMADLGKQVNIIKIKDDGIGSMAGLRQGDIVLAFNEKRIHSASELQSFLYNSERGESFSLKILRNKKEINLTVIFDKKAYTRERYLKRAFAYTGLDLMESTVKIKSGAQMLGYGAVISDDGWILTSQHLLGKKKNVIVQMQNENKTIYPAEVRATHGILGIALLKCQPNNKLKTLPFGDSKKLKVGQWIICGGNNNGPITIAMVSAINREVPPGRKVPVLGLFGMLGQPNTSPLRAYKEVIHHDGNLTEKQFGTPITNTKGQLVGINVGHFYPGTSFAIASDLIRAELAQLKNGKSVDTPLKYRTYRPKLNPVFRLFEYFTDEKKRTPENLGEIFHDFFQQHQQKKSQGFLGVRVQQEAQGIRVVEVIKGCAAQKAGIKPGDIIVRIGKQKIKSVVMLLERLRKSQPKQKMIIIVNRMVGKNSKKKKFVVILGHRPK